MAHLIDDKAAETSPESGAGEQRDRQLAIKQIERKRRFWAVTAAGTIGMLTIAAIWTISEYHNAGGWPTQGFSQSSGIRGVWNIWVIYPAVAWAFLTIVHAIMVFGRKPISERHIRREMERQAK